METANAFELKLIRNGKIPSDILKNFPFWISSNEMDTDQAYWPEAEPPEGVELVGDERWVQFPENFSRQRLLFGENEGFEIWTPDWIEISQKHDGLLFVVEGFNEIDPDDYEFSAYPSVHIHLRFKSELNRMAAIRDIRKLIREQNEQKTKEQQDNAIIFFGRYPESVFYIYPKWLGHETSDSSENQPGNGDRT